MCNEPITFISFYTNDFYRTELNRLIRSCLRLDQPIYVSGWAGHGDWIHDAACKAIFCWKQRMRLRGTLMFVDADAVVHRHQEIPTAPDWSDRIGVRVRNGRVLSGTILIPDAFQAQTVLACWAMRCIPQRNRDRTPDQALLSQVLDFSEHGGNAFELPDSVCAIVGEQDNPAIEHLQASREFCPEQHSDEQREQRRQRIKQIERLLSDGS